MSGEAYHYNRESDTKLICNANRVVGVKVCSRDAQSRFARALCAPLDNKVADVAFAAAASPTTLVHLAE